MRFQYIAVIFVIIILPITIVLSFYVQSQITVMNTQAKYTTKLNTATHDAIKSFQLNTTNSYYSSVSDSKIRDIEASVNTFYNSLTSSFNYTKSELQAYIPAIVYTLYDGYYIYGKRYNVYSNTKVNISGELQSMNITKNENGYNIEEQTEPELYEYGLKPYVYYSCRYKTEDGSYDFVVNYTLDNFISIYGKVKCYNEENGRTEPRYITKSGYLINLKDVGGIKKDSNGNATDIETYKGAYIEKSEKLSEYLRFDLSNISSGANLSNGEYPYVIHKNQKIYYYKKDGASEYTYFWYDQGVGHTIDGESARNEISKVVEQGERGAREYYINAYNFSNWVNENLKNIEQRNICDTNGNQIGNNEENNFLEFNSGNSKIFETLTQDPENPSSTFNQHRIAVIKNSIETNLITAINSYNSNAVSYAYALPKLNEEDWENVVNNVCMITFMQGLPMGGKYFNNYIVMPNDQNNEFVDIDSVYILTYDDEGKGQYHLANCPDLVENKQVRVNGEYKYFQDTIIGGYINTSFTRQTMNDEYYYKHLYNYESSKKIQTPYTACYHCLVSSTGKYDLEEIFLSNDNKLNSGDKSYNISALRSKYLTFLAREKYNLYKTNN